MGLQYLYPNPPRMGLVRARPAGCGPIAIPMYRELKLDIVDRSSPPPKLPVKTSQLLFPVSHTMDSELNIVVDELGEAAVVRARHSPPP
ncbi:hypothetical protein YC2023_059752 [Brassica napus]